MIAVLQNDLVHRACFHPFDLLPIQTHRTRDVVQIDVQDASVHALDLAGDTVAVLQSDEIFAACFRLPGKQQVKG